MNIQQLKYVVEVEREGTIRGASKKLFIAQSSLSTAIKDLEAEIGISIFSRSKKGVLLTSDGAEFIEYAKQVLNQLNVIEETYINKEKLETRFSVSSQHYDFASVAFAQLIDEHQDETCYTFRLLETATKKVLSDVRDNASEIGLIYLSEFNTKVLHRIIESYELSFVELYTFQPTVFLNRHHPLAQQPSLSYQDLLDYPALTFEQPDQSSTYFSEEPLEIQNQSKKVLISDRSSAINLMLHSTCYLTGSGIMRQSFLNEEIISIPLESSSDHVIGWVSSKKRELSPLAERYVELLNLAIAERSHPSN